MVRLARSTLVSFVGYPSSPVPITLNVISKILAFATALTLFLPQRARPTTAAEAAAAPRAAPRSDAEPATG